MFLALVFVLCANPVIIRAVERVWFAADGDFYVRFAPDMNGESYLEYLPGFTFSTSSGMWAWPAGFTAPTALPWQCNLSQTIPAFTINPSNDTFTCHISGYSGESVQWGPNCDLYTDLHPLAAGQSAVQARMLEWNYWQVNTWAKDNGIYYQTYPFDPVHRCTITVQVRDGQGNVLAGIPVSYTHTFSSPGHGSTDITNAEGIWSKNIYAARTWLRVLDPGSQFAVLDTLLYPEPDSTYHINVAVSSVAADDPLQAPGAGVLKLSPSVLTRSTGNTIHLKFEANPPLTKQVELTLYDLRGRALASLPMPVSGQTEWSLPSLSSGIYFIGLNCSGRQLARQRLTIIK